MNYQNQRLNNEDWLNEDDNEPEEAALPTETIEKMKDFIRSANRYRLEISSVRNVMIVGKSRSGKSTAVGVLKDPTMKLRLSVSSPKVPVQDSSRSLSAIPKMTPSTTF